MPLIPEHVVDQVRDAANIVDVISRYVSLKKAGRSFLGLCPFHKEKTPSFNVNPERQSYYCFGCHQGGNVFTFLMNFEKLSFVDSVKRLADEYGINIPVSQEFRQQESENERLFRANETARKFYQDELKRAGKSVKDYLKNRGLQPATVESFQIGYAPEGWDGLLKHLQANGHSLTPFQKLGLLLQSEKTRSWYDRFRGRLMFPIHNPSGKVVGFGGRDLTGDEKSPKYINSPESPVYQKSRVLYGLHLTREAIRAEGAAIFVEGYMDLVQLYQSGIQQVVATSGTALTEEHASLIRRYTQKVYLCYDADSAGQNAALRGGEVLFQNLLDVQVLILPEGEDPDSFVKNHGREAFLELLQGSQDYWEFRLQALAGKFDLQKAADRSGAVAEALTMLAPLQDNIRVNFYLERLSQRWRIPQELLLSELKKLRRKSAAASTRSAIGGKDSPEAAVSRRDADGPTLVGGAWGGEKGIILLLTNYLKDVKDFVYQNLSEDEFMNEEFRNLFTLIRKFPKKNSAHLFHFVLEHINNQTIASQIVNEVDLFSPEFDEAAWQHLLGCIKQIKIAYYRAQLATYNLRLKEVASAGGDSTQILREMQAATARIKEWQKYDCKKSLGENGK